MYFSCDAAFPTIIMQTKLIQRYYRSLHFTKYWGKDEKGDERIECACRTYTDIELQATATSSSYYYGIIIKPSN